MGCQISTAQLNQQDPIVRKTRSRHQKRKRHKGHRRHHQYRSKRKISDIDKLSRENSIISQHDHKEEAYATDHISSENSVIADEFVDIELADPEAFNQVFIQQHQKAINNASYRTTIESWRPQTLEQLAQFIKDLSKGKSKIDRYWIIFYWIALNIEYDTVSYFSKDYKDQTAEGVFRTRKGVCAGYANLYKYLCDEQRMSCEVIGGYSKGYGFDDRESAPNETDHAWNAVEIYHHWYLIDSTWGAGHLNDKEEFVHDLTPYYFLPRPNEMIYHHLPEDEKWQLLRTPINMKQYMQMPKLRPLYFELKLEIIQPQHQYFVNLEQEKPYAVVIVKAPNDVYLMADLKLDGKDIDGGHQIIFDKRKRLYYCYFAPQNIGVHKIMIYAKRGDADVGIFKSVVDLALSIKRIPENFISYPQTWKRFFDYGLKILSPSNTHLINLANTEKYAQILVRAPSNIQLMGQLTNHNEQNIAFSNLVYYDRENRFWRCKFAPNENGIFNACILAKRNSDPGNYTSAVSFKIVANQISSPPLTFPNTWQIFYDLGLKILSPIDQGIIVLSNKRLFTEIRIQAHHDVDLTSNLQNDKNEKIPNGSQIYYDQEYDVWRCKFAPNENGIFDANIFAKKKSDSEYCTPAVSFQIKVKHISSQPISLFNTEQLFHDLNLKVLSPNSGNKIVLSEKASFVEICLKCPENVELIGQLIDSNKEKVLYADQVYYDRQKNIWRCKFAPNNRGIFDARIMAKKKSDPNLYSTVITFQIEAKHRSTSILTFPKTWQLFYDYDLKIKSPRSSSTAIWSENVSYSEVLIQAPDDIQLSCNIKYKDNEIENGALAQYNHEKQTWQLLFAPEQTGLHELIVYAQRIHDNTTSARPAVMFLLYVTKLKQCIKFPTTYTQFEKTKCQIFTPLTGILNKGSTIPVHCFIPDATSVLLTVDSKSLRNDGYRDSILQRQITVGSEEVTICAKYGQNPHYTTLIKYSVE